MMIVLKYGLDVFLQFGSMGGLGQFGGCGMSPGPGMWQDWLRDCRQSSDSSFQSSGSGKPENHPFASMWQEFMKNMTAAYDNEQLGEEKKKDSACADGACANGDQDPKPDLGKFFKDLAETAQNVLPVLMDDLGKHISI